MVYGDNQLINHPIPTFFEEIFFDISEGLSNLASANQLSVAFKVLVGGCSQQDWASCQCSESGQSARMYFLRSGKLFFFGPPMWVS